MEQTMPAAMRLLTAWMMITAIIPGLIMMWTLMAAFGAQIQKRALMELGLIAWIMVRSVNNRRNAVTIRGIYLSLRQTDTHIILGGANLITLMKT